jgi:hypothetical protein
VPVEGPEVEFGQPAPAADIMLDKAIERVQAPQVLAEKKAA